MAATSPTTARARSTGTSRAATTPQRAQLGGERIGPGGGGPTATTQAPSPHYTTSLRSRHSLYGTEDRIVFDIGSSVIKAGFSGEPSPRECRRTFHTSKSVAGSNDIAAGELWGLEKGEPSEDEWRIRKHRLRTVIRKIWFENLLTDPRSRKVIVVENPLLSTRVKEMIATILFDNLQVPSLSFASAPVLSLMAAGCTSGLVVDVGHLETTVTPVYHSRPLFPYLTTTPVAGRRLNRRLRALLLAYGSHAPPPSSLNSTDLPRIGQIPREILNDDLIEEIKTRLCFVGEPVASVQEAAASATSVPQDVPLSGLDDSDPDEALVKHLYERYSDTAPATKPVSFRVPSVPAPTSLSHNVGRGWVQVPGWIRERAAEVLWEEEEGDLDERGLAGVVLECLLRLPIDLRKPMASSILITGGTAMLPGFFARFKRELLTQLERSHPPSPPPSPPLSPSEGVAVSLSEVATDDAMSVDTTTQRAPSLPLSTGAAVPERATNDDDVAKKRRRHALSTRLHYVRHSPRYSSLVHLAPHVAILNQPCPASTASSSTVARQRDGSAPSFTPALQSWVGGSLAGALKTGGGELTREMWDAVPARRAAPAEGEGGGGDGGVRMEEEDEFGFERGDREGRLPDWTRLV